MNTRLTKEDQAMIKEAKGKNNGDQGKYAETDKVRCNKGVGHQISFGLTA